jgi:ABC-type nitrate/sulfonate/bicarbonate transport system substrate-binding protein
MDDQSPLTVPLSSMRYDVTMPLVDGRVMVDGVRFAPAKTSSMVNRDVPELREGNFGLWDLNVGYWLAAIDAGWELTALPVFSKRKPVLQLIFCRRGAGIASPKDLEGKRVGTRQYRTAVTLWANGLLQDHYGVDGCRIHWVTQLRHAFPPCDPKADVECIGEKGSIVDLLLTGELDAIVTDISDAALFERLEGSPDVVRLFPDYEVEDLKLYRKTGIHTPMHVMVMSRRLDHDRPGLALKLYRAFEKAKEISYQDVAGDRAGFSVVYLRERFKEQQARWGDPNVYGVRANRPVVDAFLRYNLTQGSIRAPLPYERIFASGTLDT